MARLSTITLEKKYQILYDNQIYKKKKEKTRRKEENTRARVGAACCCVVVSVWKGAPVWKRERRHTDTGGHRQTRRERAHLGIPAKVYEKTEIGQKILK